jgi:hypothetical protein
VENRVFAAAGVFPGGDRSGPVTGSVNGIFYTAYSDQSRSFVVVFNDGPSYTYLLRNPRGAIQMGPNEWRISYDVIIQAGTEIIPGFFTAEAYYNNGRPLSFTIINSAAASVVVIIDLKP